MPYIDPNKLEAFRKAMAKHRFLFTGSIIFALLITSPVFFISRSTQLALISFSTILAIIFILWLCLQHVRKKLTPQNLQTSTVLLLSYDDEVVGQLRYLLPLESVEIVRIRSYENAIKYLKQKTPNAFIIDTNSKPKNSTTLVELCRSHQSNTARLPIIAAQKNTATETKRQLLFEGFDDCLPTPIKEKDIETFKQRWLDNKSKSIETDEANTTEAQDIQTDKEKTESTIEFNHNDVFDKKQALIQSHQNPKLAIDMLSMLIKMIEENTEPLTRFYTEMNWQQLNEITHKIKGGCYCCGVPQLEKAMEAIDKSLEKKEFGEINAQFDTMMLAIASLLTWHQEHDLEIIFSD